MMEIKIHIVKFYHDYEAYIEVLGHCAYLSTFSDPSSIDGFVKKIIKTAQEVEGDELTNKESVLEDGLIDSYLTDGKVLLCFLANPKLKKIRDKVEDHWERGEDLWDEFERERFLSKINQLPTSLVEIIASDDARKLVSSKNFTI